MEKITIEAKKREKGEEKNQEEKLVPAILYGKNKENQMLWLDQKTFEKVYKEAGESSIIDLIVSNGKELKPQKVLIYDLQHDAVTDELIHVDFYLVRMDEVIETGVALKFSGEAPAVKELGGVLVRNVDEVEVRCLPIDLPKEIVVDISKLKKFGDHIYIKDLNISEKVKINLDPETLVAIVSPPRSQEEIDELESEIEADISQVDGMEEEVSEGEDSTTDEEETKKEEPKMDEE